MRDFKKTCVCPRFPHQAKIGLVDQRRGLEGLPGKLLAHAPVGDLVQFGINQRRQLVEGRLDPRRWFSGSLRGGRALAQCAPAGAGGCAMRPPASVRYILVTVSLL